MERLPLTHIKKVLETVLKPLDGHKTPPDSYREAAAYCGKFSSDIPIGVVLKTKQFIEKIVT